MKKHTQPILALSIFLLFINILPIKVFFGSSLHTDNRTITILPSTSNINRCEWNKTWGRSGYDSGHGIALDGSGNAFITGSTRSYGEGYSDAFLLKYDSSGNLLWNKTWGGSDYDYGCGITLDVSGNAFITGYTRSFGAGNYDAFLLKYDSSGNLLWNKTWGGYNEDNGYGIALDGSGNAFITGETNSYGEGYDYDAFLLKYDSSGNLLWNKTWGGSNYDSGRGIALDGSGNAFITGFTYSYGAGGGDVFLLKYDSDGNLLWYKTWVGSGHDYGYGIALDSSGNAFITGYTRSFVAGNYDAFLLKYDSSGNLLWYKTWGGSDDENGYGIALDDSGNAFITGSTESLGAGSRDSVLLKYDSSGNLLWYKTWGGSDDDSGYGIALDGSGNAFIIGFTYSYGAGSGDAFLLKYGFDTDDDGLSDIDEINIYFTDPNNLDTDGDGLSDGDEVYSYRTDPNNADTDGDGQNDGDEIALGFDPNNPLSNSFTIFLIIIISIVIITNLSISYILIKSRLKKKKIKEINHIIKDGGDLIAKSHLDEAIESYQKAYSEAVNVLTSRKDNKEFQMIRVKHDESLTLRINQILEEVKKLQNKGEYIRSIENINLALSFKKKIKEKSLEEQLNNKIIKILDQIYVEIIEGKIEEALKLREINNFNESINKFNIALSEIHKISDKELRYKFQTIRVKHDETLTLQINLILEEVKKLQIEGKYIRSIENINLALNLKKKIMEKSLKEQFNKKIIKISDQIYVEIIEGKIEEALKLREIKNFNESNDKFNIALSKINKISDKELKDQFQSILKGHLNTTRTYKTKSIIVNLGAKYGRLEVRDIVEKCGEEEGLIISTIQDMIKNREISAEYFKGSKAVAFSQQIDVDEIDKLMKSFDEWEKEGKGKKN